MNAYLRILVCLAVGFIFLSFQAYPAIADGGVQITVIERQSGNEWFVRDFIDNSIVRNAVKPVENDRLFLPVRLVSDIDSRLPVIIQAARTQPLILFSGEFLDPMEERLAQSGRDYLAGQLERDFNRQVIGGLFQVPLWPYLAASEIPVRGIDIERECRLPDWREEFFPVATFAGTGGFKAWNIVEIVDGGAIIEETGQSGEGEGVYFEYYFQCDLDELAIITSDGADIAALYIDDTSDWGFDDSIDSIEIPSSELFGLIKSSADSVKEKKYISRNRIIDSEGAIGRFLVAGHEPGTSLIQLESGEPGVPEIPSHVASPGILGGIIINWIAFGILILIGNWLFPFTESGWLWLLGRSIAIYPLYLLLCLLTSGFWGLGFIPAAVAVSRFLAVDGRRMAATGVILSTCFGVMLISWVTI